MEVEIETPGVPERGLKAKLAKERNMSAAAAAAKAKQKERDLYEETYDVAVALFDFEMAEATQGTVKFGMKPGGESQAKAQAKAQAKVQARAQAKAQAKATASA